jgi:hypothetical protein
MYVICVQRIQFFFSLLFVLTLFMIALERACLLFFLDGSSFFFFSFSLDFFSSRLPTSKTKSNIVQF